MRDIEVVRSHMDSLTLSGSISWRRLEARLAEVGRARNVLAQVHFADDLLDLAALGRPDIHLARYVLRERVGTRSALETGHFYFGAQCDVVSFTGRVATQFLPHEVLMLRCLKYLILSLAAGFSVCLAAPTHQHVKRSDRGFKMHSSLDVVI